MLHDCGGNLLALLLNDVQQHYRTAFYRSHDAQVALSADFPEVFADRLCIRELEALARPLLSLLSAYSGDLPLDHTRPEEMRTPWPAHHDGQPGAPGSGPLG
jgi:hypothetical protein